MKNFITLLLLLISFQILAQEVTISEPISVKTDDSFELIGKLKGQYLVFRDRSTEFEVQAFDNKLKTKWNKELDLEKRRTKVMGLIPDREDFSIIYSFKKKGELNVRVRRYDPAANVLDSATVKVYDKLFLTPNFQLLRSEDKKTFLLYYIRESRTIEALAFSLRSMEVLWEKTIQPKDMKYHEDFNQMLINNQGELYIVLEKENKKYSRENHHFQVHKIDASGNTSVFEIPMKGRLTYDSQFSYDNMNKRLVAGGLYSDKNRGRTNGYFFISFDPGNPGGQKLTFGSFDEEFISNLSGKKADAKKGIADIDVREIVHRQDGGILLITERTRRLERGVGTSRTYSGSIRANVDYYFDDLFVISIHPDGNTHWKNVLHKRQYSQDDDALFSSFFLLKTPSSLRFLFNDEIKYENTVSEYVVRGNGDIDRNSVLSTENQKVQLRFSQAIQVASSELIVPSERRHKLRIVKVKY